MWLAETQGFYTLTVGRPQAVVPSVAKATPGTTLHIDGKDLNVVDIKMASCAGAEGELPQIVPMGTTRRSLDLQGAGLSFATIELHDGEIDFYSGRYATFAECGFKNLRDVPGWTPGAAAAAAQATSFACPRCAAPITIRASGLTMSAVCASCGSVVDADDANHTLLAKARQGAAAIDAKLPIGARGVLQGTDFEVIGCVDRSDGTSGWQEYLLFNPWRGFVWLVTYNGHWAFIERLLQDPVPAGRGVRVGGDDYKLFSSYDSLIQAVVGEFYWKTAIGERTTVSDYVHPPLVASREEYPGLNEVTWSRGTYVDYMAIAKAFKVELVKPEGIWLNQPNPYGERKRGMVSLALLTAAIIIGVPDVMRDATTDA